MNEANAERKNHWENIYAKKSSQEMSWFQAHPATSLQFLKDFSIPLDARIIDIGGGDSLFVDHALKMGYSNITVLDISAHAIERAQTRLGAQATNVTWIVADITQFTPTQKYDFWHDRAVFHFLTRDNEIQQYVRLVQNSMAENGVFVLGTFSQNGPEKCSGLPITRYSESAMAELFSTDFVKIRCFEENHLTPFNTAQAFLFCNFRKKAA